MIPLCIKKNQKNPILLQFWKLRQHWFNPSAYVTSNKIYHRAKNSLWVAVWHSIFYSVPDITLQWRNDGHIGVSNHQPLECSSTVYSGSDERKHLSSASLAFVRAIQRWPVNSPHKKASNTENASIWWRHHAAIISEFFTSFHITISHLNCTPQVPWYMF